MTLRKVVIAAFVLSAAAPFAQGSVSTMGSLEQDASTVKQVQEALNAKGLDAGTADGKAGPQTRAAVKKFQASQGIKGTGKLDQQTLVALGIQATTEKNPVQDATPGNMSSTPSNPSSTPPTPATPDPASTQAPSTPQGSTAPSNK